MKESIGLLLALLLLFSPCILLQDTPKQKFESTINQSLKATIDTTSECSKIVSSKRNMQPNSKDGNKNIYIPRSATFMVY